MTHRNGSRPGLGRIGGRLYRMAMRLLPTDFRDEFGDDMVNLLDKRIRDVGVDPWERLWIWVLSLLDLARQAAALRFGPSAPSSSPEIRWRKGQLLESVRQDLGFAIRTLKRSPGFVLVAGVPLAVGIGANTVMFSLVNGVLLNSLNFEEPERLVWVQCLRRSPFESVDHRAEYLANSVMGSSSPGSRVVVPQALGSGRSG